MTKLIDNKGQKSDLEIIRPKDSKPEMLSNRAEKVTPRGKLRRA